MSTIAPKAGVVHNFCIVIFIFCHIPGSLLIKINYYTVYIKVPDLSEKEVINIHSCHVTMHHTSYLWFPHVDYYTSIDKGCYI